MASPITQNAVSGILKELYDDQKVQWLTYKDNPLTWAGDFKFSLIDLEALKSVTGAKGKARLND